MPARGKSFLSMRLQRFLSWTGLETRVFNVGNKRRVTETKTQDADYFADGEENVPCAGVGRVTIPSAA